tara:strand:- start:558 stop:1133 length:576 start_codon:yes stop_codon:yes gene_type:complete
MKIHRVVTMLGATTSSGKLASDMYDLNYKTYYSEGEDKHIPISHMDFQHLIRSFVKLCDQEEMLDRSKHMGTTKDLVKTVEEQENKILGLTTDIANLQERCNTKDDIIESLHKKLYNIVALKGHYYTFSEVPQDAEGKEFVKNCRKYLNKESYNIRVKGQHLKKELYGQGRAYHGANMEDSTHMRVYIDTK